MYALLQDAHIERPLPDGEGVARGSAGRRTAASHSVQGRAVQRPRHRPGRSRRSRPARRSPAGDRRPRAGRSCRSHQNADGGFSYISPTAAPTTDATAAAIQAIQALGENPEDDWKQRHARPRSPRSAGCSCSERRPTRSPTRLGRPSPRTSWALVAQDDKSQPFTDVPQDASRRPQGLPVPPADPSRSRPRTAPSSRARTSCSSAPRTRTHPKGTGIRPSACRLYVDDKNRSRAADIGKYGLHLQLKNVPNGEHTYKIELRRLRRQREGRRAQVHGRGAHAGAHQHAHARGRPTTPGPIYPDRVPHVDAQAVHHADADADTDAVPDGHAVPVPARARRRAPSSPARRSRRRARRPARPARAPAAAAVVPPASWVVPCSPCFPSAPSSRTSLLHRREELLGAASQGTVLAGGGSSWERFKQHARPVQGPDATVVAGMSLA